MGSTLIKNGNLGGIDYRIYNIDGIYTVYIKTGEKTSLTPNGETARVPIYSAVKSSSTLKDLTDYIEKISPKK